MFEMDYLQFSLERIVKAENPGKLLSEMTSPSNRVITRNLSMEYCFLDEFSFYLKLRNAISERPLILSPFFHRYAFFVVHFLSIIKNIF
jgi:hypothetical protein